MIVWAVATGGGVAGVVAPDLPLVGPLVQRFLADYRAEASQPNAQADQGLVASLREKLSGSPAGEGQSPALPPSGQLPVSPVSSRKPADTVTIATFNIQVFGNSKLAKTWIIDVLSHVIRQFDVVAIQEIRAKEDRIIPEFLAAVNADGSRYDFVIGPRLGARSARSSTRLSTTQTALRSIPRAFGRCRIPRTCCIANRSSRVSAPAQPRRRADSLSG